MVARDRPGLLASVATALALAGLDVRSVDAASDDAGMAVEVFPADLTDAERAKVQDAAVRAFGALKLEGYARIDFRMTPDGEFFCLEANTLPGMTELSLIPQAAAAAGITFPELCERVVQLALARYSTGEPQ